MKNTHSVKTKEYSLRIAAIVLSITCNSNPELQTWFCCLHSTLACLPTVSPLSSSSLHGHTGFCRSKTQWLLEPCFYLSSLASRVHLCCSQAAPRVTAKVLAGHCVVGTTEALSILHSDSPTRTKRSTGITFVSQQGTETNTYCKTGLSPT